MRLGSRFRDMANWNSGSLKSNRVMSELAHDSQRSGLPKTQTDEPEVEGKWLPRTTLLFILMSCGLLWAAILAAVFSLQ